jgi:hypothetical protein
MVTQMLRQGDAEVFKLYNQAKLGMMRETLAKLDRMANERPGNSLAARSVLQKKGFLVGPPRFELGTSCTPSKKYQSLTGTTA